MDLDDLLEWIENDLIRHDRLVRIVERDIELLARVGLAAGVQLLGHLDVDVLRRVVRILDTLGLGIARDLPVVIDGTGLRGRPCRVQEDLAAALAEIDIGWARSLSVCRALSLAGVTSRPWNGRMICSRFMTPPRD